MYVRVRVEITLFLLQLEIDVLTNSCYIFDYKESKKYVIL